MSFGFWSTMVITAALIIGFGLMINLDTERLKKEKEENGTPKILKVTIPILAFVGVGWLTDLMYGAIKGAMQDWIGTTILGFFPSVMLSIVGLWIWGLALSTKKVGWAVLGTLAMVIMTLASLGRVTWQNLVRLNLDYTLSQKVFPYLLLGTMVIAGAALLIFIWKVRRT